MKKARHEAILDLIEKEEIGTQDLLMVRLNEMGYAVTQATISRDIKALKLIKSPANNGQYKYVYVSSEPEDRTQKYQSIIGHAVISVDYAGNMAVIKCYAGMAQAACAAVDSLISDKVVGTLAGDDTIFALCRDEAAAGDFKKKIEKNVSKYQ